jgi:hypothetical protein
MHIACTQNEVRLSQDYMENDSTSRSFSHLSVRRHRCVDDDDDDNGENECKITANSYFDY